MSTVLIKNTHLYNKPYAERTDVLIRDGVIERIGASLAEVPADTVLDASHKTLAPGLINCHTHTYMSVFRNYADDVPFHTWLFERIMPKEDNLQPEQAFYGCLLTYAEMLRSGTTSFLDMHMFPRTTVDAADTAGMRAFLSRGLVGENRQDPGAVRRVDEFFDEAAYAKEKGSIAQFLLGPHAIYTCGEDLLRWIAELAEENGLAVHMHLSETKQEMDDCLRAHGMTPVQYVDSLGLTKNRCVFAHCVQLAEEDYAVLARPNIYAALNPASNAKLGNGFAPALEMQRRSVNLCLGTDGASSNNALNLFMEMRLLSLLAKAAAGDTLAMPAAETLSLATDRAAAALGMEGKLGVIKEGALADLILLDENAPSMQPHFDAVSAMVYSMNGSEVSDVLIDGKLVMKDRELLTIDEERVRFEVARTVQNW